MATMSSYLTSPIVTVTVGTGDAQQSFSLHQDLLIQKSEFFKSALHEYFSAGKTKSVTLEDENPELFDQFAKHLYTGKIPPTPFENQIQAYLLGEKLLATDFKSDLIFDIETSLANQPNLTVDEVISCGRLIYSGTPPGCRVRDLLSKYFASKSGRSDNSGHLWMTNGGGWNDRQKPTRIPISNPQLRRNPVYSPSSSEYGIHDRARSPVSVGASDPVGGNWNAVDWDEPPFGDDAKWKLVESGLEEMVVDVLKHSLAPRVDPAW